MLGNKGVNNGQFPLLEPFVVEQQAGMTRADRSLVAMINHWGVTECFTYDVSSI